MPGTVQHLSPSSTSVFLNLQASDTIKYVFSPPHLYYNSNHIPAREKGKILCYRWCDLFHTAFGLFQTICIFPCYLDHFRKKNSSFLYSPRSSVPQANPQVNLNWTLPICLVPAKATRDPVKGVAQPHNKVSQDNIQGTHRMWYPGCVTWADKDFNPEPIIYVLPSSKKHSFEKPLGKPSVIPVPTKLQFEFLGHRCNTDNYGGMGNILSELYWVYSLLFYRR